VSGKGGEKSDGIKLAMTVAAFVISLAAYWNVFAVGNAERVTALEVRLDEHDKRHDRAVNHETGKGSAQ
jgi:hypothetical protein